MRLAPLVLLGCGLWGQSLQLEKTIPLPGVEGRIDHFAADVRGKRIFLAALGNGTIEVIDPIAGKVVHSIAGLHEPQGLYFWPEGDRLYVANGASGKVEVLDGTFFKRIREYDFNSDPDNMRFDSKQKEVFVGYGDGAMGVISAPLGSRVGDTILEAHPESFQLEGQGPRIFVNIPSGHVTVIDRRTRSITAKWPIEAKDNFPMALDEPAHRLFVGCRKPARLLVLDTTTGRTTARVGIVEDTDDLYWDAERKRIYVMGGGGEITVIAQKTPDQYEVIAQVPTGKGARTGLFVPEFKQLYVAVPHRGKQPAALLVFRIGE